MAGVAPGRGSGRGTAAPRVQEGQGPGAEEGKVLVVAAVAVVGPKRGRGRGTAAPRVQGGQGPGTALRSVARNRRASGGGWGPEPP
eukprot:7263554-Lingulodinium_polyedra.AAC.1